MILETNLVSAQEFKSTSSIVTQMNLNLEQTLLNNVIVYDDSSNSQINNLATIVFEYRDVFFDRDIIVDILKRNECL